MTRNSIKYALVTSLIALAPALIAKPRTPVGVYAVINVEEYVTVFKKTWAKTHTSPPTAAEIENNFVTTVYPEMLNNEAVSGIALYEKWSRLNPNPPSNAKAYDWSLVDDLFNQVAEWNKDNPAKLQKTIQLVPTPGFNSPGWLLDQIYSCDYLFSEAFPVPPRGSTCGKATFNGFKEGGVPNGEPIDMDLPMPWDPTYKSAWHTFLIALAAKFGSKPELVSISVAGPTASSEEMILPTTKSTLASATQIAGLTPEQMWDKLLEYQYPCSVVTPVSNCLDYQATDLAFIVEWENAINMYGKVFSGITLIMTTGDGLPNLAGAFTFPVDLTTPFAMVCPTANMDCAAETTILSYFDLSSVGGSNAKAVQTDGMKGAGTAGGNLGVPAVKLISETTDLFSSPSQRILGGAQFAMSFSNNAAEEGCTSVFPPAGYASSSDVPVKDIPAACLNPDNPPPASLMNQTLNQKQQAEYLISKEQSEYNVLTWFFDDTSAGSSFPGPKRGLNGPAPLTYVQIYGPDISYATMHATDKVSVVMGGTVGRVSAQTLLFEAALALVLMAEF